MSGPYTVLPPELAEKIRQAFRHDVQVYYDSSILRGPADAGFEGTTLLQPPDFPRLPKEPMPQQHVPPGPEWTAMFDYTPENWRNWNMPNSDEGRKGLMNPSIDNLHARTARTYYWDNVLRRNEVYFPMGINHDAFRYVMRNFVPSGRYHTIMCHRLQMLREWVRNHETWRDARDGHRRQRNVDLNHWIPARILYVIFALGTPIAGDVIHFSFSVEMGRLIRDTHLSFMIPNLRSQFEDGPVDWERSREFWEGHPTYLATTAARVSF